MLLKPFFTFFGGKWRAAPRYPQPLHDVVIEPFAGSAGYAVRNYTRAVVLVERDPVIAALWRYLIRVRPAEISKLPIDVVDARVLKVCPEARALIGFWLNKGTNATCHTPSKWMRDHAKEGTRLNTYWGAGVRARIATQVEHIRHWRIIEGDYTRAPARKATWFIDPPYEASGTRYVCRVEDINLSALAQWSRARKGQTIVCENVGAKWLPFKYFAHLKSLEGAHGKSNSAEVMWYKEE
jgi:16S rRNA G966 N2-methylase RsmD